MLAMNELVEGHAHIPVITPSAERTSAGAGPHGIAVVPAG
jgi:hypothetical protein